METDHFIHWLWQRDVPPASDMTFVLATLQRIERRRLRRGLCAVLFAGVFATLLLWQCWSLLVEWSMPMLDTLQSMTQLDLFVVSLAVTVVIYLEARLFR